jgi:MFS family permease
MHAEVAETKARQGRWATFAALRSPNFRLYWCAMFSSVLGLTTEFVALGWLVLALTNSPLSLGGVGLARALPNIALSLVGGTLADRVNRRNLLVGTHAFIAALFFGLGALVTSGLVEVWHVYVFAIIQGSTRALESPMRQSLVANIVPREDIGSAVALGNVVWQLPRLIGPASAGVVIATAGIGSTFYMAGVCLLAATAFFALMRIGHLPSTGRGRSFLGSMLEGFSFIRRSPLLTALIGLTFFDSVFGMSYSTLLPVFARDVIQVGDEGAGSQGLGLLHTATACGGLVGILVAVRLARGSHRGWSLLAASGAYGALIAAFALSTSLAPSLLLIACIGLTHEVYMTIINTVLLLRVPDEFRGRVMGVYGLAWSIVPLGGVFSGAVAEYAGAPAAVALGGLLVLSMAITLAAVPLVRNLD